MPERRICSFTHEEIEPGTGMMFVKREVVCSTSRTVRRARTCSSSGAIRADSSGPVATRRAASSDLEGFCLQTLRFPRTNLM